MLIIHADEHFNYAIYYDMRNLQPAYTFSYLAKDMRLSSANFEKASFKIDPLLPKSLRSQTDWYTNTGYNRGHMIAAKEKLYDKKDMLETFYMTNIAPQEEEFNAGCWLDIEGYICETLHEDDEIDSLICVRGSNILICDTLKKTNNERLTIPTQFFVYCRIVRGKKISYACFVINQPDTENSHSWKRHSVEKDSIEATYKIVLP